MADRLAILKDETRLKRSSTAFYTGTSSPEGSVTAETGSIFIRTDSPNGQVWTKQSGTGNTGWINLGSGTGSNLRSISGATTLTTTDYIVLANSTSGAFTVTLPAATSGRKIIIKDSGGSAQTNNITLSPASGSIDGASSFIINNNYQSVDLVSDGTNWFVV